MNSTAMASANPPTDWVHVVLRGDTFRPTWTKSPFRGGGHGSNPGGCVSPGSGHAGPAVWWQLVVLRSIVEHIVQPLRCAGHRVLLTGVLYNCPYNQHISPYLASHDIEPKALKFVARNSTLHGQRATAALALAHSKSINPQAAFHVLIRADQVFCKALPISQCSPDVITFAKGDALSNASTYSADQIHVVGRTMVSAFSSALSVYPAKGPGIAQHTLHELHRHFGDSSKRALEPSDFTSGNSADRARKRQKDPDPLFVDCLKSAHLRNYIRFCRPAYSASVGATNASAAALHLQLPYNRSWCPAWRQAA